MKCRRRDEILLIGGDHNAQIGRHANKKKEQFKNSKTENIDWKKLRSEKYQVAYQKEIENTSLREEPSWNDLADVMKKAAKKVCGLQDTRSKTNQWMVGHEDEASEFKVKIQTLVKERNATKEKDELRKKLKTTRREYKKKLKTWENEWWNNLLKECEEAMLRQDIGEMYSILKQLGLRDQVIPNSESTLISAETFKEHFERIQEKRDENSLAQKVQARKIIRKFAKPSTEGQKAAQELNECPSEEEVMKEWKKIKERAPGEDAIRMIYLKSSPLSSKKKLSMLCRRCSKVPLRIGMI